MKYTYSSHTIGHVVIPELDGNGKPVMVLPDKAAVDAARAANTANEAKVKASIKAGVVMATKDVAAGDRAAANARVMPVAAVPVATVKIAQDVVMSMGNTYDLPADNADVANLVLLGYLVAVPEPKKVETTVKVETKTDISASTTTNTTKGDSTTKKTDGKPDSKVDNKPDSTSSTTPV